MERWRPQPGNFHCREPVLRDIWRKMDGSSSSCSCCCPTLSPQFFATWQHLWQNLSFSCGFSCLRLWRLLCLLLCIHLWLLLYLVLSLLLCLVLSLQPMYWRSQFCPISCLCIDLSLRVSTEQSVARKTTLRPCLNAQAREWKNKIGLFRCASFAVNLHSRLPSHWLLLCLLVGCSVPSLLLLYCILLWLLSWSTPP